MISTWVQQIGEESPLHRPWSSNPPRPLFTQLSTAIFVFLLSEAVFLEEGGLLCPQPPQCGMRGCCSQV